MKVVFGLGNPGDRYQATRHNIGFRIVDRLVWLMKAQPVSTGLPAELFRPSGEASVWFVKPMTFMNLSGRVVRGLEALPGLSGLLPEDCLVVLDDIYLPSGKLRLKSSGSDGGHNGLASMIEAFGTDQLPRLRVGVGPVPDNMDLKDFVLEALEGEILEDATRTVDRAVECARSCVEHGVLSAMNRCNGRWIQGDDDGERI